MSNRAEPNPGAALFSPASGAGPSLLRPGVASPEAEGFCFSLDSSDSEELLLWSSPILDCGKGKGVVMDGRTRPTYPRRAAPPAGVHGRRSPLGAVASTASSSGVAGHSELARCSAPVASRPSCGRRWVPLVADRRRWRPAAVLSQSPCRIM